MPTPDGPPDKFTYLQTLNLDSSAVASKLSDFWSQGYTGPYVVVGTVIYIAGYKK